MSEFREIRRKRQQLSDEESIGILQKATAGTLALLGDNDYPYAVPISYVYYERKLYFHSALAGHKVDAIRNCDKASFCVIDKDEVHPEKYTTFFRSVIAFGRIHIIEDEAEKLQMARMLGNRYNPNDDESLKKEIESGLSRMLMIRFDIEHLTGKEAIELVKQRLLESDNFVKLVKEGYYDGRLFHRVIKDFMIQGGDPDSKGAPADKMLGVSGPDYTLEAEIKEGLFHKRGALAAAGEGDEAVGLQIRLNGEGRSSGSQFYIVWGQVYNEGQLRQFSKQLKMQKIQSAFKELASQHGDEIMQMRGERKAVLRILTVSTLYLVKLKRVSMLWS